MSYPYIYRLRPPIYSYSEDGTKTHTDKLRGLLHHSPLRPAHTLRPKCLFVFIQDDRDHANKLYLSLRNGIARFPGCSQLTGMVLERDSVESLVVPAEQERNQAREFYHALENRLGSQQPKPDFAFILYSRQPSPNVLDPYDVSKAILTKYGIPSQYISWELLDSPQQFGYAISNVALSFFVKLGGTPWSVRLERRVPTLVVGIGRAETQDIDSSTRRRLIGYAVCTLSSGLYLDTRFFPPAETYEEFLSSLSQGLREALIAVIRESDSVGKITVHASQWERHDTLDVINETLRDFSLPEKAPIPFEVLRLTADSDFSVFDMSNSGYVSEEGTVVALGPEHALLVTEGRREKAVWRGRKPVTLEVHREYASSRNLPFRDSIEDAFRLSSVNWRGFNAITQPISLQYAKLLTQQVAKMSTIEPKICSYLQSFEEFNRAPWFI